MTSKSQYSALDQLKKKMTQLKEDTNRFKCEYDKNIEQYQNEILCRQEAESQVPTLNRRIQVLEQNLERLEKHIIPTRIKIDESTQIIDDNERLRKALENKINSDDRVALLDKQVNVFKQIATEAEKKYNEVTQKLIVTGIKLEKTEEKAERSCKQIAELEGELRLIDKNLKSLETSHEKGMSQQKYYNNLLETLEKELREVESRADIAERSAEKLQNEANKLENELLNEKEKNKYLSEEIEATMHDSCDI